MLFMQDSVRKLLLEAVLVEERLDPPRNDRLLQYLVDVWASVHVHSQHLRDEGLEFTAEVGRERGKLATDDLQGEEVEVHALERRL